MDFILLAGNLLLEHWKTAGLSTEGVFSILQLLLLPMETVAFPDCIILHLYLNFNLLKHKTIMDLIMLQNK